MITWNKLKIRVQHPAGTIRRGTNSDGANWSQCMPYDYGEIIGTLGIDKEPVDCILGNNLSSSKVYVCKLTKDKGNEDKCMIGFATLDAAKKAFISCYGGKIDFLEKITALSLKKFKILIKSRRGLSLMADFGNDGVDFTTTIKLIEPLPSGWNTKVENPGDREMPKEDKAFQKKLINNLPKPQVVQVSQGADINISPALIFSNKD